MLRNSPIVSLERNVENLDKKINSLSEKFKNNLMGDAAAFTNMQEKIDFILEKLEKMLERICNAEVEIENLCSFCEMLAKEEDEKLDEEYIVENGEKMKIG